MSVEALTAYLEANPDGAVVQDIARDTGRRLDHVQKTLKSMRRYTYIDRYENGDPMRAVWVLVQVPEDCPRPPKRRAA